MLSKFATLLLLILSLCQIIPKIKCSSATSGLQNLADTFKQCLISQSTTSLGYCLGAGAINKLQSLDSDPEFDLVDGITLSRDQQEYREAYNFQEQDPASFRTLFDSVSHVFSRRNLHWDMGFVYPGLAMRVAPSTNPGGVLEFVLDPHREVLTKHSFKEIGTGRLLARQFLLPFLLGFKFNVASIIPILFGILALIAKKAIIISKLALIVSAAYALGALMLGNGDPNKYQGYTNTYRPGFGDHYNRYPEEEFHEVVYRGLAGEEHRNLNGHHQESDSTSNNDNHNNMDQFKLYANLDEAYEREDKTKGRNFAWSEDEKRKKTI